MTNKQEHSLRSDGGTDTRNDSKVFDTFFGGDVGSGIEESEIFHILGNDRRREIICALARESDEITVSELAREIADIEEDLDSSKNLYKSVYVSLQQTHLPKLAKKDIVVYDKDVQTVRPGPAFPQIQRYLRESESRLSQMRVLLPFVLSALGLAVAMGTTMQVPVVQHVGPLVAGGIFLVLMVVLVVSPTFQ